MTTALTNYTENGMIKTFRSRGPELLYARKSVALFHPIELAQGVEPLVRRKLAHLNAAEELHDLAVPPQNCLKPLTRDVKGSFSIRITNSWQLCFTWRDRDAYDVDLVRAHPPGNFMVAENESDLLPPVHPGDILLHDFMWPHLISGNKLAAAIHLPLSEIAAIVHGQAGVTADAAFGLGSFFGTTPELWLNLQRDYDLQVAESAKLAAIG
jgi:addiction module HigA family antidote